MELNIFMRELESALVRRGIPGETAKKHVASLRRTFTNDDLSEIESIQSGSEIEQLADSISRVLKKNMQPERKPAPKQASPSPSPAAKPKQAGTAVTPSPSRSVAERPASEPPVNRPAAQKQPKPTPKPEPTVQRRKIDIPEDDDEQYYSSYSPGADVTTRGMITFWVGLILTLPITLGLALILFGAFAAVFVALSLLIVLLIIALIAVAACGAGVSLVGIIFGITQLFTFVAAGIYEIGLGIMVAGAVLFLSVLLYNIAIRLLPWLISQVGNLLGWVCGKLKNLFYVVRRECYKL